MRTRSHIQTMLVLLALAAATVTKGQNQVETKSEVKIKPGTDTYDYRNAIGFRAGETSGLTFKHKMAGGNAFEAIMSFWPYRAGFTGLYEKHISTGAQGLNWYFGAGAHLNYGRAYRSYYYYYERGDRYVYVERRGRMGLGLDGIIGLEYKIKPIPLAISADLKPFVETNTYGYTFLALDPGIGLKFTF